MVFVLDKHKQPLMPCTEKRARLMLQRGRARVHRLAPFTIRLIDRTAKESALQPIALKLDPGSRTTGIALARIGGATIHTMALIELTHRGAHIRKALMQRAGFRRRRRAANLRYRKPRFDNRRRTEGWLAPSLQHRADTTMAWVKRLRRLVPISALAQELVRFDMQAMQQPGISGVEYQQGTLAGYEIREYLLEKWGRACAYCDAVNVPLQIEHVVPKSGKGSNRIANLAIACEPCNTKKGKQPIEDFLAHDPARLAKILAQLKAPLNDAAAVNSTRWALFHALERTGLPVTTGSGGQTKFNRTNLGLQKTHALDALCVGPMNAITSVQRFEQPTLAIKATGRGAYKRTRLTPHGFPRGYLMRTKRVRGFTTGDHVQAIVPSGKHAGVHIGRVAVRASGSFNIQTAAQTIQGVNAKYCRLLQRADGYAYLLSATHERTRLIPGLKAEVSVA
ncbi:MAG: RNA-guided endonuclease IscB [Vulcanimicrobiaceae bacterium]